MKARLGRGAGKGRRWVVGLMACGLLAILACTREAEAVSPRRLVELVDIGQPVITPDGARVAFRTEQAAIERNAYDTAWYVQDVDGRSPPWRVADGGLPLRDSAGVALPARAAWSPDGRWIYFIAFIDGKADVWRAAADGSGARPLTRDPADIRDFSLSTDGNTLLYAVGATREEVATAELEEYDEGIRIEESTPLGQNLFRSGYIGGRLATQRLGHWFNRVPLLADVQDRWKRIDLRTGEVREEAEAPAPAVNPEDAAGRIRQDIWKHALEPQGHRMAVLIRVGDKPAGQRDRLGVQLAVLDGTGTPELVVCRHALCSGRAITDIQWRPASDEVLFTVTDPDLGLAQSILRWNVDSGVVAEVARGDGLMNGGRDQASQCGASTEAIVCVTASARRPPRLERIDIESGQRVVLYDPNEALAQAVARTTHVRLLRWSDQAGRVFTGQFYPARKAGGDAPPLFVTYYTCPGFVRGGLGDEWPLVSLAEHGISALCINRLPGYTLDATDRYGEGLAAVESAIDTLAAAGEVDGTKVGMGGLSFGTEVTLWTLTHSDRITAASISSPMLSRTLFLLGSLKGENFMAGLSRNWQVGSIEQTGERWRQLAPELRLETIKAPVLMQVPEQEYIHTLDYAIPLVRERKADLYVFPHEAHQKFQPRHKLAVYQRNLDWFRFWLLGSEDSDPAKAEQYASWRSMRAAKDSGAVTQESMAGH